MKILLYRKNLTQQIYVIKTTHSDNSNITALKENGKLETDPVVKANILNRQFHSVFTERQSISRDEFINQTNIQSKRKDFDTVNDIDITVNGVKKLLDGLNPYKASGPDNIKPRLLKELSDVIVPILTTIFRLSYETGEIPDAWRTALVTPAFKKGQKYKAENYRPISLTCVCCKIFELIVTSHIMKHAERSNILFPLQHGFRKGRSCETQLIEFTDDITKNMENGKQTDVLIMDFSKAFDKVSHSLLLHKLDHYGIRGKTNRWIQAFLTGRSQSVVVVEGQKSQSVDVESGVPQGSVLGPSLFLFYINDIPTGIDSTVRLFADDTVVYLTISSDNDCPVLHADLAKLQEWETRWKMAFHPDKCNVLSITRKKKPINHAYMLHNHKLEHVTSAKYLGVTFNNEMDFGQHINTITNKASSTLGFLRRNLNIGSVKVKTEAYQTYVIMLDRQ